VGLIGLITPTKELGGWHRLECRLIAMSGEDLICIEIETSGIVFSSRFVVVIVINYELSPVDGYPFWATKSYLIPLYLPVEVDIIHLCITVKLTFA
jgi:hypothetical protein